MEDDLALKKLKGESADSMSRNDYMALHPRCAVCHWPAERSGRWLELHHIVSGPGRKDLPNGESWIAICCRCHHALHHQRMPGYEDLNRGAILTAKEEEDGPVDTGKLAALKHKKALPYEKEPIPKSYLRDRTRRGGDPWP